MRTTHFTVRKQGQDWAVQLVTPMPAGCAPLRTVVATYDSEEGAIDHAMTSAAKTGRPYFARKARA